MDEHDPADLNDANLDGANLVPVLHGSLADIKEMRERCAAADIPVQVVQGCAPGSSCGGKKLDLLVREEDIPRVAALMQRAWVDMVVREGTISRRSGAGPEAVDDDGEPPCPACGTAAPLVQGACSDCGLMLA